MKRLFVAAIAPGELKNAVKEWRQAYRRLPVRWTAEKNLHMTLLPPWSDGDDSMYRTALTEIKFKPFSVDFDRIGYGSGFEGVPRLIWASGPHNPELEALVDTASAKLGLPRPKRRILPHVTVARFNPERFDSFPLKHIEDRISWRIIIKEVVLMESHLLPEGADYEIVESVKSYE